MSLANQIAENGTMIIISDESTYKATLKDTLKIATQDLCCYVTFNKTCSSLGDFFKKNGVPLKNVKFIDAITRTIKDVESTQDCTYISSPESLTELAIVLKKHLEFPFKYLIFDSVTDLITYADVNNVKKFIKSISYQCGEAKCKLILIAVENSDNKAMIRTLGTFVDATITYQKNQ
ncbi:hypothetical protein J4219_08680 [Candidatus Woesearchaeota archaeon]|nr:hypothetical protein [Candidatus Woesearchaeota archaeon]